MLVMRFASEVCMIMVVLLALAVAGMSCGSAVRDHGPSHAPLHAKHAADVCILSAPHPTPNLPDSELFLPMFRVMPTEVMPPLSRPPTAIFHPPEIHV
jgi:hypothetical protein